MIWWISFKFVVDINMDKREFIDSVKAEFMDVGQDLDYDNIVGGENDTFVLFCLL